MEFKQIVLSRYATKKFDGKIIEQNKIILKLENKLKFYGIE